MACFVNVHILSFMNTINPLMSSVRCIGRPEQKDKWGKKVKPKREQRIMKKDSNIYPKTRLKYLSIRMRLHDRREFKQTLQQRLFERILKARFQIHLRFYTLRLSSWCIQ